MNKKTTVSIIKEEHEISHFTGFPAAGVKFLSELKNNNSREWFEGRKSDYQALLKQPAENFSSIMTDQLEHLTGKQFSAKIFRINRDVRFSKDKTPYNTHVRILFSALDPSTADGCTGGFFFSLEPSAIILGAGSYAFSSRALDAYREAIIDHTRGSKLDTLLKALLGKPGIEMDEPELKRSPAGYEKNHPREHLLRRKSLAVWFKDAHTENLLSASAPKFALNKYQQLLPLYDWISDILQPAG